MGEATFLYLPPPRWGRVGARVPPRAPAARLRALGRRRVLEVIGLSKRFGGFTAVREVGFELAEREILGLIGPNGSGKSTIFNLIAGALRPNAGSIRFQGREIA